MDAGHWRTVGGMTVYSFRYTGTLPGGEQFNTGLHTVSPTADITAAMGIAIGFAQRLFLDTGSGGTSYLSLCDVSTTVTTATVTELDPVTGKAIAKREQLVSGYVGTGVGNPLPQEVAVVLTLRTLTPGPSGRGRLYMPAPTVEQVGADARLITAAQDKCLASILAGLDYLVLANYVPILFTKAKPNRSIVRADVGNVFDAQRRRRNKLIEVRVTGDVS